MTHRVTMESIKRSLRDIREGLQLQGSDIPPELPLAQWRERMVPAGLLTGVFTDNTLIGDGLHNNPLGVNLTWHDTTIPVVTIGNVDGGTF